VTTDGVQVSHSNMSSSISIIIIIIIITKCLYLQVVSECSIHSDEFYILL